MLLAPGAICSTYGRAGATAGLSLAQAQLHELVHTRRCDPTELFPSLARFARTPGVLILGAGQL